MGKIALNISMQLYEKLQEEVLKWREQGYPCDDFSSMKEILEFNKDENGNLRYLREPQFRCLEVYWYLRVKLKTPKFLDLYRYFFNDEFERAQALGIPENHDTMKLIVKDDIYKKIKDDDEFAKNIHADSLRESLELNYPSYILALAMGAGKTVLIGAIIATEFAMSLEYPEADFMKNALVFAPGTTIIESLREISEMPFDKILPARFYKIFMANIKMLYTRSGEKDIPAQEGSTYNIIVTNTEKIALRRVMQRSGQFKIEFEEKQKQEELFANRRLTKIASLPNLGVFSDEAHHTYGNKLGEELKRVRSTIDHLSEETNLVCVVNTTGTPYYQRQALKDVVFWYSLDQGIKDNILKSLYQGVVAYDFKVWSQEKVIDHIINDFYSKYKKTKLARGEKAKIAFYFKTQEHLDGAKKFIEKSLIKIGESPTQILVNTQKSKKEEIEEFNDLNNPDSNKRVILLIGKGTEGWNCPSLFATALIRELTSSNNFILQASTRCLRQKPENKQNATIYIESHNQRILNKELEDTFKTSLSDLNRQSPEMDEQIVKILKEKYPRLEITRIINKIVKDEKKQGDIKLKEPKDIKEEKIYKTIFEPKSSGSSTILLPTGEVGEIPFETKTYDVYTATKKIAANYHLDFLKVLKEIKRLYPKNEVPRSHLQNLFNQVEKQTQNYKTIEEKIVQALAIIKLQDSDGNNVFERDEDGIYFHTIRYKKGEDNLISFKKDFKNTNKSDFGFHYDPYKFDSEPEEEFFETMLSKLQLKAKDIEDIYFTGGLTNTNQTDFYFQYKGTDGRYHDYFPDFLIVKKDGSFLIVEIKQEGKENDHEVQIKAKAVEKLENIKTNKFKYQIIYTNTPIAMNKYEEIDEWVKK